MAVIECAPPRPLRAADRRSAGQPATDPAAGWQRSRPGCSWPSPLALLILFTYVPVGEHVLVQLHRWDGFDPDKEFVGLDNYVEIFTRPELFQVFFVSLYYLVGARSCSSVLALYFATMLSFSTRFRNLFKGDHLLPLPDQRGRDRPRLPLLLPARRHPRHPARRSFGVQDTPQWLGDPSSSTSRSPRRRSGATWASTSCCSSARSSRSRPSCTRPRTSTARRVAASSATSSCPASSRIIGLSFILAISGASRSSRSRTS